MEINYLTIMHGDSKAYPARTATVVNLAGTPFDDAFSPLSKVKGAAFEKASISFLLEEISRQAEEDGETTAVVFTSGEPCLQANVLLQLCSELQTRGFKVKLDTNGFYPEELKSLLPYVNYISLEVKTKLDEAHYSRILGNSTQFTSFYQRLLRTFAFLEDAKVMREVKTPIIGGFNNKKTIVESIASEITKFADLYVLEQWTITSEFARNAGYHPPSRQELIELAAAARNIFPKVSIRTLYTQDQEIVKHK